MNQKILIICRDFFPYALSPGWSMRVLKLAEYLNEQGYRVFIISGKCGKIIGYFGYEEIIKRFNSIYVEDVLKQKEMDSIKNEKFGQSSKLGLFLSKFGSLTTGYKFFKKCLKRAKNLIEEEGIENVIISSPPHGMQLIGPKLKKIFGNKINLIVDYRDSWSTTKIFSQRSSFSPWLNTVFEKRVLKNADHITYVSPPIIKKIMEKFGDDLEKKSSLILNGYDEKMLEDYSGKAEKCVDKGFINIGHFGGLVYDDNRKRSNFFSWLNRFLNNNPKFKAKLKMHFYGLVNIDKEYCLGNCDNVVFNDFIPHKDALKLMSSMDYLLILHEERDASDEAMKGKLFDYISVKKPVIIIGPKDMEAKRFLRKNNIGLEIDISDEKDLNLKFHDILGGKIAKEDYYRNFCIQEFSRQNQFKKFLGLLKL